MSLVNMCEYNKITEKILADSDRVYRNNNGQFFTKYSQVELCLKHVLKYKPITECTTILEPSFGTGQFLDKLQEYKCNITGIPIIIKPTILWEDYDE